MNELDVIVEESCKHSHVYLEKNFPSHWVEDFKIGFLPKGKLRELINEFDLDREALRKLGILFEHDYCPFEERVIIPIYDGKKLVGIAGRYPNKILPDSVKTKYINSIFQKDEFFFTRPNLLPKRSDRLIIVEGYTDVMAINDLGEGIIGVGLMGTSLSAKRVERLRRMPIDKMAFLDGDRAGRMAIINAYEKINGVFSGIYDCNGFDPEEFVNYTNTLPTSLSLQVFCLKYYRMYFDDEKFVNFLLQNGLGHLYKQTVS